MITVVRHGSTALNDGTEKLRGWLNVPLSSKGKEEALAAGVKLRELGLDYDSAQSSPLKRAVQTSDFITPEIDNEEIEPKDFLLDWNTGDLTGKSVKDTLPVIHKFIDNHDKSIPGGESFDNFLSRIVPKLKKLVEDDGNHLIVTHNRVTTLLNALSKNSGSYPEKSILKKRGPIKPGGIIIVNPDWSIDHVFKKQNINDV